MSIVFENDFYIVQVKLSKRDDIWLARAETIRKDSGENLASLSFGAADSDKEGVLNRVYEKLDIRKKDLLLQPNDWGDPASYHSIVRFYVARKEALKDFRFAVENDFLSGNLSAEILGERLCDFDEMVKKFTISIVRKVSVLKEVEQEKLLFSPEEVYGNIHGRGHFEDVYARRDLFDYILNPTAQMVELHRAHEARCKELFNKKKS